MRTLLPYAMITLLGACGSPEPDPAAKTTEAEGTKMKMAMALTVARNSGSMRCYESTDVDAISEVAYDRPFTYLVRYLASPVDPRVLLSTVIPHRANMTYKLVDEAIVDGSVWKITFQAYDDPAIAKGLFVHTNLRIPWVFDGTSITDVELAVLDQSGVSTGESGGVSGQPKTKKPQRRRMDDIPDEDPTLPPKEDVTIYTNGNLVSGKQYVLGFAQVNGMGSGLSLTDDLPTATVTFAATTGGTAMEFLQFEEDVTAFTTKPAVCTFTDGDGDAGTDPRPNIVRP